MGNRLTRALRIPPARGASPSLPSPPSMDPCVRRATPASYDPARLGRAMRDAFFDDSASTFLWPDPEVRDAGLRWYYGSLVPRLGFGSGRVYVAASGAGQSVWIAPGRGITVPAALRAGVLGGVPRFGVAASLRLKRLADTIDALRAEAAPPGHWYLLLLGVAPEAQRTGLGAALMAPLVGEADAGRRAVYLETSDPATLPYYRRHGFEVVGERRVPGAHRYWGMARPPA